MGTEKRARQKAGRAARLAQEATTQKQTQRRRSFTSMLVIVVIVLAVFGILALLNKGKKGDDSATSTSSTVAATSTTTATGAAPFSFGTAECPKEDGSSPRTLSFAAGPKNCLAKGASYTATFDTTAGKVVVALDTTKTPGTANNFIFLSRFHYYDGTDLFRVAKSIDIIQGGAPHTQSNVDPGPGYNIADEGGSYTYKPGDLVMARTSAPNSAGAQYFFSTGPNTAGLDSQGTYVVFGHVTEGLEVLQKAVASATGSDEGNQAPSPKVTVTKVTISQH